MTDGYAYAEKLKHVFIVGTPKSGTTFLMSLFNSAPSAITLLESAAYFFPNTVYKGKDELIAAVDNFFMEKYQRLHPLLKREGFLRYIRKYADRGIPIKKVILESLFATVLDGLGPKKGAVTHLIEKRPDHYLVADRIFKDFPEAKMIHILRDPRDNYLALKRLMSEAEYEDRTNYHPMLFIENRLVASFDYAYRNAAAFGERYRIIFYEDLIRERGKILRPLMTWMGMAWNENILTPTLGDGLWKGNSTSPDLREKLKPFDLRPLGRWHGSLSRSEAGLMEYVIQAYRLEDKYKIDHPHTRLGIFLDIILPFQGELARESSKWRSNFPVSFLSFLWNYFRRRLKIYRHLNNMLGLADNRIIDSSFKSA